MAHSKTESTAAIGETRGIFFRKFRFSTFSLHFSLCVSERDALNLIKQSCFPFYRDKREIYYVAGRSFQVQINRVQEVKNQ